MSAHLYVNLKSTAWVPGLMFVAGALTHPMPSCRVPVSFGAPVSVVGPWVPVASPDFGHPQSYPRAGY